MSAGIKITADLIAAMSVMRAAGASNEEIAADLKIGKRTVSKYLAGQGEKSRRAMADKRRAPGKGRVMDEPEDFVPGRVKALRISMGLDPITGAPA